MKLGTKAEGTWLTKAEGRRWWGGGGGGGGGYRDGVEERAERFVAEVEGLELMMRQVCANTCRIAVRARI